MSHRKGGRMAPNHRQWCYARRCKDSVTTEGYLFCDYHQRMLPPALEVLIACTWDGKARLVLMQEARDLISPKVAP